MLLFSRRWFQCKRTPPVATLDEVERASDLEEGRAAATPITEVARVAGREERGTMANQRLDSEGEPKTKLERATTAAPLIIALNETRCQTEKKALTEEDGEEASQEEKGAAQLLVKEAPALNSASAECLDRNEVTSMAQQDQFTRQHCAERTSSLAAEEQRTENDVYASKLCLEEQQREGMPEFGTQQKCVLLITYLQRCFVHSYRQDHSARRQSRLEIHWRCNRKPCGHPSEPELNRCGTVLMAPSRLATVGRCARPPLGGRTSSRQRWSACRDGAENELFCR